MKSKLITHLRVVATKLENAESAYNWYISQHCNCGILACSLLGMRPWQLSRALGPGATTWCRLVRDNCPATGLPRIKILKSLFAEGLTADDFRHLEQLNAPLVLARLGVKRLNKTSRLSVARYMRAWAGLLVEQGRIEEPPLLKAPSEAASDLAPV